MQNESIVIFSSDDWGWKTSKYQLSIRFAKHNKVLFVSSIGFRAPKASTADLGRIFNKLKSFLGGMRKVEENLFVLTPLIIPFSWFPFQFQVNQKLINAQVALARWYLDMTDPYIFIFSQNWYRYVHQMKRAKLVYYCVDEHSGFSGIDESQFEEQDKKMNRLADVIFCSSRTLYEKNVLGNPNTHYMPHGVNYDLFASSLNDTVDVAPELQGLPRPVVLFFGHVSYDWVDKELVKFLAASKPQWSFVYVGRYSMAAKEFEEYKNIHIVGERNFEDLPRFCKGADVATIPFVDSVLTRNCNPLKLPEYLAAGLPVVSTAIPEVRKFGDLVYVADDYAGFLAYLEDAVNKKTPALSQELSSAMAVHSWDHRVAEILRIARADTGATT